MRLTPRHVGLLATAIAMIGPMPSSAWAAWHSATTRNFLEVSGRITAIDLERNALTLEYAGDPVGASSPARKANFLVDAKATISDGQQPMPLAQLAPGQNVVIKYLRAWNGKQVAHEIWLKPASPTATLEETPTASHAESHEPAPSSMETNL